MIKIVVWLVDFKAYSKMAWVHSRHHLLIQSLNMLHQVRKEKNVINIDDGEGDRKEKRLPWTQDEDVRLVS